ncbi:hypothetical protein niasHT_034994 [Heterodera trifolii]|uniref:Uncharacterized protein n=1 Tax=Heterodera trifolii TaxID=157864 RepID=A0ABD2I3Z4_9BILA
MIISFLTRLVLLLPQISYTDSVRLAQIAEGGRERQNEFAKSAPPLAAFVGVANFTAATTELRKAYLERKKAREEKAKRTKAKVEEKRTKAKPTREMHSPIDDNRRKALIQVGGLISGNARGRD